MQLLKQDPDLSIKNLVKMAKKSFEKISKDKDMKFKNIKHSSILMSGLAIFYLKYASLLEYNNCKGTPTEDNLKKLFSIEKVPSDTYFREIIDEINTKELLNIFQNYVTLLKEKNVLNGYQVFNDYVLVSIDGTGFCQSNKVKCGCCLERKSRNGLISYEHQALPAVIIHPSKKSVFPIGVEFIGKKDGETKNDCERNAAKRLISHLHKTYPDLKMIIVEDSLSSNVPHVKELEAHKMKYILGIKPGDHKKFFENLDRLKSENKFVNHKIEIDTEKEKIIRNIKYKNTVDLSSKNEGMYVNYFEVDETVINKKSKKNNAEKVTHFSWITSFPIGLENINELISRCSEIDFFT